MQTEARDRCLQMAGPSVKSTCQRGAPFETPPVPGSTCGVIVESRQGVSCGKKSSPKK